MFLTAALSLLAGGLTVLAPCVLPFLPVIVGGSLQGQKLRPYIVAASLVVSLLLFTLLLKVSTVLIGVDPRFWTTVSGLLVIALGFVMLFPSLWAKISVRLKLDSSSHALLEKASSHKSGFASAVLTGVALGPVFSSCSPTYAWVIASVLPAAPVEGFIYLALYCVGVAGALLAISLLGRRLIARLRWAANPYGWFQRIVAALFIVVGVLVATGADKAFQAWAVKYVPNIGVLEEALLPDQNASGTSPATTTHENNTDGAHFNANYQAPEFTGLGEWINSEPLELSQLKGKVVLVDFWTYSCVNCIRTQPYLNDWYSKYHDKGLEIVGIHAPEFAFEKLPANVKKAVEEAKIEYPVALDNNFSTWNAYENRYWPAKYLIDQEGTVRYVHFGEGEYEETEENIRTLLATDDEGSSSSPSQTTSFLEGRGASAGQSPETYLGLSRASGFHALGEAEVADLAYSKLSPGVHNFGTFTSESASTNLESDEWSLGGAWKISDENIVAAEDGAQLSYKFSGKEMYLVLGRDEDEATASADAPLKVQVSIDAGRSSDWGVDAPQGVVTVDEARLYRLVKLPQFEEGTLVTLTFAKGISAHAFTFGS